MGCVMIFCSLDAILTDWRCTDACVVRVWSAASGVATDFCLARAPHDRSLNWGHANRLWNFHGGKQLELEGKEAAAGEKSC